MPTTVILPPQFKLAALYRFTREIVGGLGEPLDNHFIFDFSRLHFIDGYGLTVLCNTLEWLGQNRVRRQFQNWRAHTQAISYLDDCGFFERYLGQRLNPHGRTRGTTLPFTQLTHDRAHEWLEYRFSPWAAPALHVTEVALGSVRTCIKEVFNNILDHTRQRIGFVHAQHYPNMDTLNVTVSDFGPGIPDKIRSKYGAMSDEAAIRLATTRGVTTKDNPNNWGFGLDYLIEYVSGNGGKVRIYSYGGGVICTRDSGGGVLYREIAGDGSYPGTLVDILLRTDLFVGDEETREDVEW